MRLSPRMMAGQCLKKRHMEPKTGIGVQGKTLCFQGNKCNTKSLKLLLKRVERVVTV